jgi:trimethylamine-N-oxide reductase (cytochrome c)
MPRAEGRLAPRSGIRHCRAPGDPAALLDANWQESGLPKTLVHTHLMSEEPLKFTGMGAIEGAVANQFVKHQFPIATKDGSRIHMMWTDCPCRVTCWNGGNDTELALRSPQVECIVTQHPWLENDTLWSDIILPANTHMEVDDIVTNVRQGGQWADVMLCDKAVEPIGESKSDYEIVLRLLKLGYEKQVSEGLTLDLQKKIFGYGPELPDLGRVP